MSDGEGEEDEEGSDGASADEDEDVLEDDSIHAFEGHTGEALPGTAAGAVEEATKAAAGHQGCLAAVARLGRLHAATICCTPPHPRRPALSYGRRRVLGGLEPAAARPGGHRRLG